MIILMNSSKTLNFQQPPQILKHTIPELLNDAEFLVDKLRAFSESDLSKLMGVSRERVRQVECRGKERLRKWFVRHRAGGAGLPGGRKKGPLSKMRRSAGAHLD